MTATAGTTEAEPQALPGDGLREGIIDELRRRIGDALVATELRPNDDLWLRVATDSWKAAGEALLEMGFEYFCFLSAIDWMPSPYGRGEDDPTEPPPERPTEIRQGVTGGDTRFQVLARVTDVRRHVGVTVKVDVPEDSLTIESWFTVYAGANWHERETHEMFGIQFAGHPDLRNMYLPTEFEGFPLRKDFPLLARMVKPWPGIVDVEPMPAEQAPAPNESGVVTALAPARGGDDTSSGEGSASDYTPPAQESSEPQPSETKQSDGGVGEPPAADAAEAEAAATSAEEAPEQIPAPEPPVADEQPPELPSAPPADGVASPPDASDPTGIVQHANLTEPDRDTLSEPEPEERTEATDEAGERGGPPS